MNAPIQDPLERVAEASGIGRMGLWLVFSLLALLAVYWFAPQMVKVTLYKLSLLPAATYVLYWIDRALNERRPHEYFTEAEALRAKSDAVPPDPEQPGMRGHEYYDLIRRAEVLEATGQKRLDRRVWLITGGMIATALGS